MEDPPVSKTDIDEEAPRCLHPPSFDTWWHLMVRREGRARPSQPSDQRSDRSGWSRSSRSWIQRHLARTA